MLLTTDGLLGEVLDVHVRVLGQLLQHRLHLFLQSTGGRRMEELLACMCVVVWGGEGGSEREEAVLRGSEDVADLLEGLGNVEADVGHLVAGHLEHHRQHVLSGDLRAAHIEQSLTDTHQDC